MKQCDVCNKLDKVHYRVKLIKYKTWIFSCKECWHLISKQEKYCYGGTRKAWSYRSTDREMREFKIFELYLNLFKIVLKLFQGEIAERCLTSTFSVIPVRQTIYRYSLVRHIYSHQEFSLSRAYWERIYPNWKSFLDLLSCILLMDSW